jgi:outer membrane protein TolC
MQVNKKKVFGGALLLVGLFNSVSALSLEEALRLSQKDSRAAKKLEAEVIRSEEQVNEIASIVWPTLKAYASAGVGQQPSAMGSSESSGAAPDLDSETEAVKGLYGMLGGFSEAFKPQVHEVYSYGLQAEYPLITFGKISTAIEVAEFQAKAVKGIYKRGLQEVQMGVVSSWAQLLEAQKASANLESSQKRLIELNQFLERNLKMGMGFKSDVLRSKAAVSSLKAQKIYLKKNEARLLLAFNQVSGLPVENEVKLDTTLGNLEWLKASEVSKQQALTNRGDLRALDMQKRIWLGGEKIDKAEYLPTIGLSAKAGVTAYDEVSGLGEWDNREWQLGIGLTWNLFDGFASSSRAAQKKMEARKLDLDRMQLEEQISFDISRAFKDVEATLEAEKASKEALEALSESVELMHQDFKAGKGSLFELLSAEEALRTGEEAWLKAWLQTILGKANIWYLAGKDLVSVSDLREVK